MPSIPKRCVRALEKRLRPELFKALCDPNRLSLVLRLAVAEDSMNVSEASGCCGVHISGTSRHLSMLKHAGVVVAERRGREVRYRLNATHLVDTLRGLADALEDCCGTVPLSESSVSLEEEGSNDART